MARGTIYGYTSNQYIDAKIEWSADADAANNWSTVWAALYYKRNNTGFTTSGTGNFSISVAGIHHSENRSISSAAFSATLHP